MTDYWHALIERIHAAPAQAVIAVTGGGASAISGLLSVPGGSRTLLEAIVPYSAAALIDWLGRRPDHFCVEETALAMAAVAHERAGRLVTTPSPATVGVACTASLISDRPKKGDHRCHVAAQTATRSAAWSLVLEKGARDRNAEEQLVGHLILRALACAAGIVDLPPLDLRPGEAVIEHRADADPLLVELLAGKRGVVWSLPDFADVQKSDERKETSEKRDASSLPTHEPPSSILHPHRSPLHPSIPFPLSPPTGLLCGAFHPLHFGHQELRRVAERKLGGPVYYEMSIRNVDKPPLDFLSIERRRAQFTDHPLALTAAPTFAEKAVVLPGVMFVVGVDTAERIVEPRYYGGSDVEMRAALATIRDAGCRFLVAGRKAGERFETLADIALPAEFANLFAALPADEFRADVSSTELRRAEDP